MGKMDLFGSKESKGRALFNEVQVKQDNEGEHDLNVNQVSSREEPNSRESNFSDNRDNGYNENVKSGYKSVGVSNEDKNISELVETLDKIKDLIIGLKLSTQLENNDDKIIEIAEELSVTATVALDLESTLTGRRLESIDDLILDINEVKKMIGLNDNDKEDNSENHTDGRIDSFADLADNTAVESVRQDEPKEVNAQDVESFFAGANKNSTSTMPVSEPRATADVSDAKDSRNESEDVEDSLLNRPYVNVLRNLSRKILSPGTNKELLGDRIKTLNLDSIPSSKIRKELSSKLDGMDIKSGKDLNDILTLSSLLKIKNLK